MPQLFLIVLVLVALAFLGLGINIFFFHKPFPETEIGKNKEMRKRGIKCVKGEEMRLANMQKRKINNLKNVSLDLERLQSDENN